MQRLCPCVQVTHVTCQDSPQRQLCNPGHDSAITFNWQTVWLPYIPALYLVQFSNGCSYSCELAQASLQAILQGYQWETSNETQYVRTLHGPLSQLTNTHSILGRGHAGMNQAWIV
jgi:hypothetical protein